MSPRILALPRCPHCKAELAAPTPRVCPACGGSLQKRFLSIGCLTSAPPPVILLGLCLAAFVGGGKRAEPERSPPAAEPLPAAEARAAIASGAEHL